MRRALVLLATILAITSCALNEGDELADKLDKELAHVEGIADVDLDPQNALPFAGSVHGTITLEDGVSESRIAEIVDLLGRKVHDGDYDLVVSVDGIGLEIARTASQNRSGLALLRQARDLPDISVGTLSYARTDAAACIDQVEVAKGKDPISVFGSARDLQDETSGCEGRGLTVQAGGHQMITDVPAGGQPDRKSPPIDAELEGLKAVQERVGVQSYRVTPKLLTITIAQVSDLKVAEQAAKTDPSVKVAVTAGNIAGWSSDLPVADLMITLSELPSVEEVADGGDQLRVTVRRIEDLLAIAHTVIPEPGAADLEILFTHGDGNDPSAFSVQGEPNQLQPLVDGAIALKAYTPLILRANLDQVTVPTSAVLDAIRVLKPLVDPGATVRISDAATDRAVSFTVGPQINIDDSFYEGESGKLARAIEDSW